MAYDRDLYSNPLRALRGTVMESDADNNTKRRLHKSIDYYLAICTTHHTQQAAASGIMAAWMARKCEGEMLALPASTPGFKLASLCFGKHSQLANACFKIAENSRSKPTRGMKPPTRDSSESPHAQVG